MIICSHGNSRVVPSRSSSTLSVSLSLCIQRLPNALSKYIRWLKRKPGTIIHSVASSTVAAIRRDDWTTSVLSCTTLLLEFHLRQSFSIKLTTKRQGPPAGWRCCDKSGSLVFGDLADRMDRSRLTRLHVFEHALEVSLVSQVRKKCPLEKRLVFLSDLFNKVVSRLAFIPPRVAQLSPVRCELSPHLAQQHPSVVHSPRSNEGQLRCDQCTPYLTLGASLYA